MQNSYNIFDLIYNLPNQIKAAKHLSVNIHRPKRIDYQNIVISGMGGSGIGGEILKALLVNTLPIPIITVKDYFLPAYTNKNTLFFAVSYSGNTEETMQCFTEARHRKCHLITITSGGKILEISKKNNIDYIELPKGPSSRCAIGYLFISLLLCLTRLGLIKKMDNDIDETAKVLFANRKKYNFYAQKLAPKLNAKLPLVYSTSSLFEPVAKRWQTQLNENAEVIAHSNVFPELNHNEIVGISDSYPLVPLYYLILIDQKTHTRNLLRVGYTFDIIKNRNHAKIFKKYIKVEKFFPNGKSNLARMFSLIMLGDLISYHLAHARQVIPESITAIDELKMKLDRCKFVKRR